MRERRTCFSLGIDRSQEPIDGVFPLGQRSPQRLLRPLRRPGHGPLHPPQHPRPFTQHVEVVVLNGDGGLPCLLPFLVDQRQALGQALSAGTVAGVVLDPNNAAVPNATIKIANSVTGYTRTVTSNADGTFRFDNVPPNNYQLSVAASGFQDATQNLSVRTSAPWLAALQDHYLLKIWMSTE